MYNDPSRKKAENASYKQQRQRVDAGALMHGFFLEKQEDSGARVQMPKHMRGTAPTASLAMPSGKMGINLPPSRTLNAQGRHTAGVEWDANAVRSVVFVNEVFTVCI